YLRSLMTTLFYGIIFIFFSSRRRHTRSVSAFLLNRSSDLSAGMVDAGFENQKELTKMQLDNQKEIAEMHNETQKEIDGIQSATSRQNTKDQVYEQNEMLAYQQLKSTARVASIMENTNLSKQQQVSEIMRQMLTQAQTAGQYFTNDQIKEMTRKVSAEVDLVHQQTQNQRYGSSHIGATAKDISNVVTDAASGV